MTDRKMVNVSVIHSGGFREEIITDNAELLGAWLIYTAHKLPENEKTLQGNWHVRGWELQQ